MARCIVVMIFGNRRNLGRRCGMGCLAGRGYKRSDTTAEALQGGTVCGNDRAWSLSSLGMELLSMQDRDTDLV